MVSILVVSYNTLADTRRCVAALLQRSDVPHEVVVVDNASQDGTQVWLRSESDRIRCILNERNLGFAPAVNQAARATTGDIVVMLNADVLVPPGWLGRLCRHIADGVGAVGPLATACGPQQNLLGVDATDEQRFLRANLDLMRRYPGTSKEVGFLAAFCLAMRRDVFDRLGGLDESMRLGADDFDLCLRLQRSGMRLLVALDVFVRHLGHRAFAASGQAEQQMLTESWDAFNRKWSGQIADWNQTFFGKGAEPVVLRLG